LQFRHPRWENFAEICEAVIRFLIFISGFLAVYFGMHYLVYLRVYQTLGVTGRAKTALMIFFLLAGVGLVIGIFFFRKLPFFPLYYLSAVWFGVIAIGFSVFTVRELVFLAIRQSAGTLTVVSLAVTVLIVVYSLWNGARPPVVVNIEVPVNGLHGDFENLKIVQLSDLHLTRFKPLEEVRYVVDTVNAIKPDLVVITGDLIDDTAEALAGHTALLKKLKAVHGVIAVTGNHEYYAGTDNFYRIASQNGWKVLRNGAATVAGGLQVIGIDDRQGRSYHDYMAVLQPLFSKIDRSKPSLLLSHRAKVFDAAASLGADLTLAGHYHSGQIPPLDFLVNIFLKYPHGLYGKNGSALYTTSGTSTWGPPMRFLSRSEIVAVTLVSAGVLPEV
jgi:predicted MPP superfamily phosphohydrolase